MGVTSGIYLSTSSFGSDFALRNGGPKCGVRASAHTCEGRTLFSAVAPQL